MKRPGLRGWVASELLGEFEPASLVGAVRAAALRSLSDMFPSSALPRSLAPAGPHAGDIEAIGPWLAGR
jgi:hypothetical protein